MAIHAMRRFLRKLKRNAENTLLYLKFAAEGNRVERITDFNRMSKPILLLHGLAATRRVFQILENRLRMDGYSIFTLHLGGLADTFNTDPINESASFVAKKVKRLYAKYKIKGKLTIIGHSKGGLIGRYYVKKYGGAEFTQCLITLGTPHNGTPWAFIGYFTLLGLFSKSLLQMIPASKFIRELNHTPWPRGVKIISIYSKEDPFAIYPSAMLDPKGNPNVHNLEIPSQGHTDFLITKKSYRVIRQALKLKIKK